MVQLTDSDVKKLKSIINKKDTSQTTANRCSILLALDENHPPIQSYDQCVGMLNVSRATIATVAKTFSLGGIDAALKRKRSINSDNARRKVDRCTEANLIEIACGSAPKGHSWWTIRLLEAELKVILDETISREAIRRIEKKSI